MPSPWGAGSSSLHSYGQGDHRCETHDEATWSRPTFEREDKKRSRGNCECLSQFSCQREGGRMGLRSPSPSSPTFIHLPTTHPHLFQATTNIITSMIFDFISSLICVHGQVVFRNDCIAMRLYVRSLDPLASFFRFILTRSTFPLYALPFVVILLCFLRSGSCFSWLPVVMLCCSEIPPKKSSFEKVP